MICIYYYTILLLYADPKPTVFLFVTPMLTESLFANSDECYCDDDYGLYPKVEDGGCSTHCSDDSEDTCGGHNTIAIYQLKGMLSTA